MLVLPYLRADYRDNEAAFLDYYDEVKICEEAARSHFKTGRRAGLRCRVGRCFDLVEVEAGDPHTAGNTRTYFIHNIRYSPRLSNERRGKKITRPIILDAFCVCRSALVAEAGFEPTTFGL